MHRIGPEQFFFLFLNKYTQVYKLYAHLLFTNKFRIIAKESLFEWSIIWIYSRHFRFFLLLPVHLSVIMTMIFWNYDLWKGILVNWLLLILKIVQKTLTRIHLNSRTHKHWCWACMKIDFTTVNSIPLWKYYKHAPLSANNQCIVKDNFNLCFFFH